LFLILLNICTLALPKRDKIGDQKNLLTNLISLKFVVSNIRDALGANYFIRQINILSEIYSIKKKIFWTIVVELFEIFENQPRATICFDLTVIHV